MGAPQPSYTNNSNISLSIAAWLVDDEYDYIDDPNYISVTTLMKHPRQLILNRRVPPPSAQNTMDVADAMARKIGHAVHSSIESTWRYRHAECLNKLGYPDYTIKRIRINPTPEEVVPGIIPIYLEQRAFRKMGKYNIGGKFDFVGDGALEDFKSTLVFYYMNGNNDAKYILQGSLYRWLNPDIITQNHMNIQFIFTDWKKHEAKYKADQGYPQMRMVSRKYNLMSLPETEVWVQRKLALLESLENTPEPELPLCDSEALWQDRPTYKYYKNPNNTNRSTKNFDTMAEANLRWIEDGRVGVIHEVPGPAKACLYCDAFSICSQKDTLIANGTLTL